MLRMKTLCLILIQLFFATTALAGEGDCQTLKVTYPDKSFSGTYAITTQTNDGAAVYKATATAVNWTTEGSDIYLYRFPVLFNEEGFVWVISLQEPTTARWQALAYGEGQAPDVAEWIYGIRVECLDPTPAEPPNFPAPPDRTIDAMFIYTEQARLAYINEGPCGEKTAPDCGINSHVKKIVRAMNEAMDHSGVGQNFINIVHIGPADFNDADVNNFPAVVNLSKLPDNATNEQRQSAVANRSEAVMATFSSDWEGNYPLWMPNFVREIQARRNAFHADVVHLLFGASGQYVGACGLGLVAIAGTDTYPRKAYSFTRAGCQTHGIYTMAHEMGHNLGLRHTYFRDYENLGRPIPSDATKDRGYVDLRSKFFTIMAYAQDCDSRVKKGSCKFEPRFSNPDVSVTLNGIDVATGSATENAAAGLQRNFPIVANFRPADREVHLTSWPTGQTYADQPFADILIPETQSVKAKVYVYNNTGRSMHLWEVTVAVQPDHDLSLASTFTSDFKPCDPSTIIADRDFCTIGLRLTASGPVSSTTKRLQVNFVFNPPRQPTNLISSSAFVGYKIVR